MKKKFLLMTFVFLISGIIFMADVDAALGQYLVTRISHQKYQLYGSTTSLPVWLNLYQATVDGIPADTYCVDPGLAYGGGGAYYLNRYIDPSTNNALDLAIAGALNEMENIRDEVGGGDTFHLIGTVAMRWVFMAYGGSRDAGTPQLHRDYMAFKNSDTAVSVSGNTAIIAYARQVFVNAINAVLSGSYDNAVSQGFIWGPKFTAVEYTETVVNSTTKKVTFIIQSEDEASTPDKFIEYIDGFTAACSNTTVTCTVNSKTARTEPAGILIDMNIDITNWDGQDFGITVNPAYCDSRDAGMQVLLLQRSNAVQRMLVVMPGSCPATPTDTTRRPTRSSVHVNSGPRNGESCVCDTTTGIYTYQKYENGNLVAQDSWSESSSNYQEMMDKYADVGCPGTCTVTPQPEKHICEIVDGQHYCEDGQPCNEDDYIRQCLCNPVVTVPSDCNNFDTASTETGYISDIATTDRNCNNSEVVNQVKQCVIDNDDATGETFEATNELSGNPYCKVWCSESYDFELPTAQYSTSGGYFTLSTTISGTRNCYVSAADDPTQGIDEQKFINTIISLQKDLIDQWNAYNYNKTWLSERERSKASSDSYFHKTCNRSCCQFDSEGYIISFGSFNYSSYEYTIVNENTLNAQLIVTPDSGRVSSITYGERPTCDGGKDCDDCDEGSDGAAELEDDRSEHESAMNEALSQMREILEEINEQIILFNSCSGVISNDTPISDLITSVPSSTSTSSWDNDMQFEPTVDFVYDQDYMNQMSGKFKQISDDDSSEYMYCSGDTDDEYNCQSGSSPSEIQRSFTFVTCYENGCRDVTVNVGDSNWVRKTKSHEAEYIVDDEFSTYTQYGTIKVKWDRCNGNDCLWTDLPEGSIPVSLITETGVFPFKFTFGNIGQSNSSTTLGRLIGNNVSVLTEYNKLDDKYKCGGNVSATTDGGYVCHYLNNCPGCDFTCDDDNNCEFDDCDGGYCSLVCPNCVFDGENANFSYRTVSLNNMFPNDREIGYNWSQTAKSEATLQEIENAGESIYEEPQYSYTLSPTNLRNIREYNDDAGSYTNSRTPESVNGEDAAVYCDNVTIDGKTYSVRCKSRFLDLIDSSGNEYATNVIRPDPDDNSSWTLFSDTQYCPNGNCLSDGLGPAWK